MHSVEDWKHKAYLNFGHAMFFERCLMITYIPFYFDEGHTKKKMSERFCDCYFCNYLFPILLRRRSSVESNKAAVDRK